MKLRLRDRLDAAAMGRITDAVLRADLGSRINFEPAANVVRIENWLSVEATVAAIEQGGHAVAAVLDGTNDVPRFLPARVAPRGTASARASAAA